MSAYVIAMCFGISLMETRKNTLEEHVSRVLLNTLAKEYGAQDTNRVEQTLLEELNRSSGTNSRMETQIGCMDLEKGIIHVVVKEFFRQINGRERVITCEKTVIMDEKRKEDRVTLQGVSKETDGSQVYENAYAYYQKYGKEMSFKPKDDTEAGIFYATNAKSATSQKLVYETIGWRVTVKDSAGVQMDQIFYALDGEYIRVADKRTVDGYRYRLYHISLDTLKARLSDKAQEALKKADCSIVFDACVVVKRNGVQEGGMTDEGIAWGTVYTTYDGIVNAAKWSKKTKETLKTYFSKEIPDLFFDVNITYGEGIERVEGAGRYCYGTEVTIDAIPKKGYTFAQWDGDFATARKQCTFTVYEDTSIHASSTREALKVHLYRNLDAKDTYKETLYLPFGEGSKTLEEMGWSKEGYHHTGWSTSRIVAKPYFAVRQTFTEEWMESVVPSVDLYATWEPNSYRIVFLGNGAKEGDREQRADYTEWLVLPEDGFTFSNGSLVGWSLSPEAQEPDFACGERIAVEQLAKAAGAATKDGASLYLYAIKDAYGKISDNIRFLSQRYYKDEEGNWIDARNGGLSEHSIWRKKKEYWEILDALFLK